MKKIAACILASLLVGLSAASCGTDDDLLTYKYNYDLSEYITLADYKNLPAEGYAYEVTDEEVEQQIFATRSYYARTTEITDRPARIGDIVYIDYVGTIDGAEFEGGSEIDCEVTLGTGTFIDGFEESVVGLNPGESVSIDLTFPEPYPAYPENAGKDVHFEITLDSVYEQEVPLYTEDFVRAYLGFDSIEAFETHVRELLEERYTSVYYGYIDSQTWPQIVENTTVLKYPEAEMEAMYNDIVTSNTAYAEAIGLSLSAYLSATYGMTEEEFYENARLEVEERIKEEMICYAIAREEGISMSEEEYQERAAAYALENFNLTSVEAFENLYDKEAIRQTLMFDKVHETIVDLADVSK